MLACHLVSVWLSWYTRCYGDRVCVRLLWCRLSTSLHVCQQRNVWRHIRVMWLPARLDRFSLWSRYVSLSNATMIETSDWEERYAVQRVIKYYDRGFMSSSANQLTESASGYCGNEHVVQCRWCVWNARSSSTVDIYYFIYVCPANHCLYHVLPSNIKISYSLTEQARSYRIIAH